MKGISPFVASIMLIAFTVAAGAIISLWFTSFSQKTTAGVGEQTTAVSKCTGALKITFVSNSKVVAEPTTSGLDRLEITSIVDSKGTILNQTKVNITGATSIPINEPASGAQWVKASGRCTYNNQVVPIEAVCYKGQSCWAVKS